MVETIIQIKVKPFLYSNLSSCIWNHFSRVFLDISADESSFSA